MNKKTVIRFALASVLVGLSACGGSDSNSDRQRNAAIETNVLHYNGVIHVEESEGDAKETVDSYTFAFDLNLDTESAIPISFPNTSYWVGDYRRALSNLKVKKVGDFDTNNDLSSITWAKCPYSAGFSSSTKDPSELDSFILQFVEATDDDIAGAECGMPREGEMASGLYDNVNQNVAKAEHRRFYIVFAASPIASIDSSNGTLKTFLPDGLGSRIGEATGQIYGALRTLAKDSQGFDPLGLASPPFTEQHLYVKLGAEKLKDYAPFDVTAVPDDAGLDISWKPSADLDPEEMAYHLVAISSDGFKSAPSNWQYKSQRILSEMYVPGCDLFRAFPGLATGDTLSIKVQGMSERGLGAAFSEVVTVQKTDEIMNCLPQSLPSPTNVTSSFDALNGTYSVSWYAPRTAGITFCVESSSSKFGDVDEISTICVGEETTLTEEWLGWRSRSFRIVATTSDGIQSRPSKLTELAIPGVNPVTDVEASITDEGVKVNWKPAAQPGGVEANTFSLQWAVLDGDKPNGEIKDGYVRFSNTFTIPVSEYPAAFVPGSEMVIVVVPCSSHTCGDPNSVSVQYPGTNTPVESTTSTLAPGAAAKSAVADPAVTEIVLPQGSQDVAITPVDIAAGFGVVKQDLQSVEWKISDGEWVTLAEGSSISIPKNAKKLTVRVTKKNGETVESVKTISAPAESTDTTMAPADTTVTESTVVSPAPDSGSSGVNPMLIVLAIVVALGAIGVFIKLKKPASR